MKNPSDAPYTGKVNPDDEMRARAAMQAFLVRMLVGVARQDRAWARELLAAAHALRLP